MQNWLAWIARHERPLSAGGMIAGFVSDNFLFRRVDLPNTQLVFIAYLAVAAVSIALLHIFAAAPDAPKPRWRAFLPIATQFALGGLWSGFLIFYTRSAVIFASWPFLLLLAGIFIGNEVLKRYHERLVFTSVLFFFALFSYAIATVPIVTRTIGMLTFLLSGVLAVAIFVLFLYVLAVFGREQYLRARWKIAAGSALVYATVNAFYFTDILPPLPLALARAGIYNLVKKTGKTYVALGEEAPWYSSFGVPAVVHVAPGGSLYLYSAVFAPIKLTTKIVHRWQRYNPKRQDWVTQSTVIFPITGGRDGGYRGYSIKTKPAAGDWRVNIATTEGHLIGRVRFTVILQAPPQAPVTQVLD